MSAVASFCWASGLTERQETVTMLRLLAFASLFALSGCAPPTLAEKDAKECESMGAQTGTQSYTDCRLRLKEMRSREEAARLSNPTPRN